MKILVEKSTAGDHRFFLAEDVGFVVVNPHLHLDRFFGSYEFLPAIRLILIGGFWHPKVIKAQQRTSQIGVIRWIDWPFHQFFPFSYLFVMDQYLAAGCR